MTTHSASTQGVGGLPFANTTSTFSQYSQSSQSHSHSQSQQQPDAYITPAEPPVSTSPLPPPPHLGPGGIPTPPVIASTPALQSALLAPTHQGKRHRSWGEKLVYEIGTSYAIGFIGGSCYGALDGLFKPAKVLKLRVNSVLNNASKHGSTYANGFAVFSLIYSMSRSASRWYGRRREARSLGVAFQPAPYRPSDDKYEAIGALVAGSVTAYTRMPAMNALGCGLALGSLMYGGLALRRVYWDSQGKKVPIQF